MNSSELKKLIISSLDHKSDPAEVSSRLQEEGISYDFSKSFKDKVIDRIFETGLAVSREVDFVKNLNFVFYRIALSGVAAILILLLSIFLAEGSISLNSLLGLKDNYDESIVCLLTGN
jgi:hypothetical protein